jgi:hypothetical protein
MADRALEGSSLRRSRYAAGRCWAASSPTFDELLEALDDRHDLLTVCDISVAETRVLGVPGLSWISGRTFG